MSTGADTPARESNVANDLSQFHAAFFDETAEHLEVFESLLLILNLAAPDLEQLNAIFRAAHSIKGGSSTFGFTDMAEVTHELEFLLDRARNGELMLTVEMIDALLAAGDVLKLQLARHRGDSQVPVPAVEEVCARIQAFVSVDISSENILAPPPPQVSRRLQIGFPYGDNMPEELVLDLRALGELESQECQDGYCTIHLETTASVQAIQETLFFFSEPANIKISTLEETPDDLGYGFFEDETTTLPEDPGYGFFDDDPTSVVANSNESLHENKNSDLQSEAPILMNRRSTDKISVTGQGDTSTIRVGTEKVDQLMNQIGELVITQAMLAESVSKLNPTTHQNILTGMSTLMRNTRDLQNSVMSIRMMPISTVFNRFPRMARDLAAKLGKNLQLVMEGEATEVDKGLLEKLADPLTHLVRNSIDHGVETSEQRLTAGKAPQGTITLRAYHQGGGVMIEVCDDGAGLQRERILAKAREQGLPVSDNMSDQDVWRLIFEAGFSTAEQVTDVSGRGVGMDVVKRNIAELGGSVEIESKVGHGTRIIVRLPLTLAIIEGMCIMVGGSIYVIPIAVVVESMQVHNADLRSMAGGAGVLVKVRDDFLPVIALREVLPSNPPQIIPERSILLVVEHDRVKKALVVDELLGRRQVVVKSLESNYRKVEGIDGATIMGDGRVALILDVAALVNL